MFRGALVTLVIVVLAGLVLEVPFTSPVAAGESSARGAYGRPSGRRVHLLPPL